MTDHSRLINITGENVQLGPFERDQIPLYTGWFNDFETLRTQGDPVPAPMPTGVTERWYDEYVLGRQDVVWFTVYERSSGKPIGWTELKDSQNVTPIGMAIDGRDRVYVLESHTHTPPKNYTGPKGDVIKVFVDENGDGRTDGDPTHFTDGIQAGMNLGFSRDGTLYVCAAWEVLALPDEDGDGMADEKKTILRLETRNTYPHSAQMGITFSHDDWIYVSRGNNGGHAWTVQGTDHSRISGFGDGGSVYRCRLDGSQVQAVATGFWNSMNLKFDSHARLLLVDNDPDARGPNRLVHVVEQGDYGYKSIFGGGGNHPFQGWDGTLPGTLGYVDGVGEAPCDLIDTDRTSFPVDYRDQLLVTVWNENAIARYVPEQDGSTIKATHSVWLQGDADFRPVALEADSKGNLYITDWVKVDYPNHGHGRIWRVSAKEGSSSFARLQPRGSFAVPEEQPGAAGFAALITATDADDFKRLERALVDDDAFIRHAAVVALSRPVFLGSLIKTMYRGDARVRLGALLAMRRGGISNPELYLKRFLGDPDENVRRAALMWAGEEALVNLRPELDRAIAFDDLSATVFETYLAAVETLDPAFVEGLRDTSRPAKNVPRRRDPAVVEGILRDEKRPDRVRALALTHLENAGAESSAALLRELAAHGKPALQREAIRSLSETSADAQALFLEIAADSTQLADIRAEAVQGLVKSFFDQPKPLLPLLEDPAAEVRVATLRALVPHANNPEVKAALETRRRSLLSASPDSFELEEIEEALVPIGSFAESSGPKRPTTLAAWQERLKNGGDTAAGERVFFATKTQCSGCHLMNNRGRRIGPELSNIGQSVSREQIIASIIQPSAQFAPEYQAWQVKLKDGEVFQGLQLDHQANGGIDLFTSEGLTRSWKGAEIADYGVLPRSLMPDGLETTMSIGEFRDLAAFLESLK